MKINTSSPHFYIPIKSKTNVPTQAQMDKALSEALKYESKLFKEVRDESNRWGNTTPRFSICDRFEYYMHFQDDVATHLSIVGFISDELALKRFLKQPPNPKPSLYGDSKPHLCSERTRSASYH